MQRDSFLITSTLEVKQQAVLVAGQPMPNIYIQVEVEVMRAWDAPQVEATERIVMDSCYEFATRGFNAKQLFETLWGRVEQLYPEDTVSVRVGPLRRIREVVPLGVRANPP